MSTLKNLSDHTLKGKQIQQGSESGLRYIGKLNFSGIPADGGTLTLDSSFSFTVAGEVYEYDTTGNGVTAGRIAIDTSAAATAADARDATLAAINANGNVGVSAVAGETSLGGGATLYLAVKDQEAVLPSSSFVLSATNVVVLHNDVTNGMPPVGLPRIAMWRRAVTAAEVTEGEATFKANFQIKGALVTIRTSAGVIKPWSTDGVIAFNGSTVTELKVRDAVTDQFVAGDQIDALVWG